MADPRSIYHKLYGIFQFQTIKPIIHKISVHNSFGYNSARVALFHVTVQSL